MAERGADGKPDGVANIEPEREPNVVADNVAQLRPVDVAIGVSFGLANESFVLRRHEVGDRN